MFSGRFSARPMGDSVGEWCRPISSIGGAEIGQRQRVPCFYTAGVRIVAGTARGLKLNAPVGSATRPTSDRVREALFNSLNSMGLLWDARVLDLFAGSGALGIEALSRGALDCTFVELRPEAIASIELNLQTTKLADHATVIRSDVMRARAELFSGADLVLADPPYDFDGWFELLELMNDVTLVAESNRSLEFPGGWDVLKERRYGDTVIHIVSAPPVESFDLLEKTQ
jgi:16S rRNA (guanine966-N2)-methyltransferase